jgi:copper chaperone NosL
LQLPSPWPATGISHMRQRRVLFAITLIILISYALVAAEDLQPRKVSPQDKCPVCGMFVAKFPDFVAQIVFKDGSQAFFDGVKDMMKYYFNLPKYNSAKTTADIGAIRVSDYYKLTVIDGHKAWYIIGSDVYGPMGKELIPFQDEAAAKEFKIDHKGKAILQFKDITPEIIKTLD